MLMEEHMHPRIHLNLATTATIVAMGFAVSLITSTLVAARAYRSRGDQAAQRECTITVKGSTRRSIRSDQAVWRIQVRGEKELLPEAFAELERGMQSVHTFLEQRGFAPEQSHLGSIDTTTHFLRDAKGAETRQVASYSLSRTCFVQTADVDRVMRAAGEVTALIQDGVQVISEAPEFYYSDLAALKIELMGAASRDARARADEIARNAGGDVAEVRSAHMGVLQITQPNSTSVSDYGIYDTSTIAKDVQAVVTVTFRMRSL
jgi:hypothetical protein